MDWYVVIKTINGNRYYYHQKTWREGKHVRTKSQYIGPAANDNMWPEGHQKGFKNLIGFHGTFAQFENFSNDALGSNTGADDAKEGFFFASNKDVAISYASTWLAARRGLEATRRLLQERIKKASGENWFYDARGKLRNGDYHHDLALENKLKSYFERYDRASKRLSDLVDRGIFKNLKLAANASLKARKLVMRKPYIYHMHGSSYSEHRYMDAIEQAQGEGCDGVIIKNTYDGLTPSYVWAGGKEASTDVYIVFDATQILPLEPSVPG